MQMYTCIALPLPTVFSQFQHCHQPLNVILATNRLTDKRCSHLNAWKVRIAE